MTVFKTFFKVLRKNMVMVISYSIILIVFGCFSYNSQNKSLSFSAVKPDILIINSDEEKGITKGLIDYIKENSNTPNIKNNEEKINDALFYNDTDYVIYIPNGFNNDFINGNINEIEVKAANNFNASYANMLINRYLKVASSYKNIIKDEDKFVSKINSVLNTQSEINITSKLDTIGLEKASFYFSFESYSLLVCLIFIIGLILSIFNNENIRKRTIISSSDYKKNNRILLLSNLLYSFIMWLIYTLIGVYVLRDTIFSTHGLLFIINSLIFLLSATTLAFLIGTAVTNKEAINGITNVVALGSSFLCGAFVPISYLPDSVERIAHVFPTYYYIKSNDLISKLEEISFNTLKPIIINSLIMIIFAIVFIILTNIISKKKRKIA